MRGVPKFSCITRKYDKHKVKRAAISPSPYPAYEYPLSGVLIATSLFIAAFSAPFYSQVVV